VVLHDPEVDRTTNGRGDIREMELAEARALSVGYPERFGDTWSGECVFRSWPRPSPWLTGGPGS
jgi:glycerophosphoryl diester phosphodiesterase